MNIIIKFEYSKTNDDEALTSVVCHTLYVFRYFSFVKVWICNAFVQAPSWFIVASALP